MTIDGGTGVGIADVEVDPWLGAEEPFRNDKW